MIYYMIYILLLYYEIKSHIFKIPLLILNMFALEKKLKYIIDFITDYYVLCKNIYKFIVELSRIIDIQNYITKIILVSFSIFVSQIFPQF